MRRWALWMVVFLLLPFSYALTVTYSHYPTYPSPGDTVRVVMNLVGNATGVEMKLDHPLFRDDYWRDVGDVAGSASYVFYISLPSDINPGYYEIPILLRFTEGNNTYTVPTAFSLRIVPKDGDVKISVEGKPVAGQRSHIVVTIVNNTDPITNTTLVVTPSLEGPYYLGTLEGRKDVDVEAIPTCEGGVEEFNVTLSGYREGPYTLSKSFVLPCVPADPVKVEADLPKEINQGFTPVRIKVFNPADVPRTFHIVVSSDAELSGTTETTFTLDGKQSKVIDVVLRPREDQDTVLLRVVVISPEGNFPFAFSTTVKKVPDVVAYLREVKPGNPPTAVVEIANLGEGEARNVVASSGDTTRFIGSLTGGDYDTVEFPVEGNKLIVSLSYTYDGQRTTREFTIEVIRQTEGVSFPWWAVIVMIAAAVYLWRRKRDRSNSNGA